jgi:excisionase family DNA binding protein
VCKGGGNMDETYYTPQEVAEKLKVNIHTIYRWIRSGKIKAVKVVDLWRISESELKRLLGE